jgi:hypothetical protein
MLYEAIQYRLKQTPGVTSLATDGIHVLRAPQAAKKFIVLMIESAQPDHHTRGTAGSVGAELHVACVMPTNVEAVNLGQAVRQTSAVPPVSVLDGFRGRISVPGKGDLFVNSCLCRGWGDVADLPQGAQQFGDVVSVVVFDIVYTENSVLL